MHLDDISQLDDIRRLVDNFYSRVQEDEILGPVFGPRLSGRWPEHLEKMYRFWQTVLLDDHAYFGAPFSPHATMPLEHFHFERWVDLFCATIDELFAGNKAEEAKWRGRKMAAMFELRIESGRHQFRDVSRPAEQ